MLCHSVHPESFPIKHSTLRHQLGATGNCGDIWRELPLVLFSERTLLGWHLVAVPFSTLRQTVSVFKLQDSCNKRRCIVLVLSWPIILLSSRTPQDDDVFWFRLLSYITVLISWTKWDFFVDFDPTAFCDISSERVTPQKTIKQLLNGYEEVTSN